VAKNQTAIVHPVTQYGVHVGVVGFLIIGHVLGGHVRDTAAIERPALFPGIQIDDIALGSVLHAIFVGHVPVIVELHIADHAAGVLKLRGAAFAIGVAHVQIGIAAERGNGL